MTTEPDGPTGRPGPEVAGSPEPLRSPAREAANLADGEWHLLHAATPLLRGGIFFLAVLGFVIANLRQRLVDLFFPEPRYGPDRDPIDAIYSSGMTGWVLLAFAGVLVLCLAAFYLAWRMHTFRVGQDAVEVRSGILFRTNRKARLDRIQGINITRPVLARIVGAAKLEISVAGQDANVQLSYLRSALADALRREILQLASGARAAARPTPEGTDATIRPAATAALAADSGSQRDVTVPDSGSGHRNAGHPEFATRVRAAVGERVGDFLAPELDPDAASPESVVKIPPGRLAGSIVLSGGTVVLVLMGLVLIAGIATGRLWLFFILLPGILGSVGFYSRQITRSLRYSIAGTPDGVRIGFGLLATSNETLPPGRIHAVEVTQSILWRPFGWWQIRIDTAGHSSQKGAAGQANTTILPVGDLADVQRVLALVMPAYATEEHRALVEEGMSSRGTRYITAPRRAAWLRPLSWRRTGYRILDGVALLRHGVVWRRLVLVPLARLQSVGVEQGPVLRALGLARAELHTVPGPVHPRLAVIDLDQAWIMFDQVAAGAIEWSGRDTSQQWRR
ncbi:MAG: PH domain-containing protein [Microbacteriaceae bacterium]